MVMINRHLLKGFRLSSDDCLIGSSEELASGLLEHIEMQHSEEMEEDVTTEKLLEPSRITVSYENIVKESGLKTWMNASVNVEPFEIKLGFRELEFFNELNKQF